MLNKFAEDLKAQREKAGISLMDIANETRLHYTVFEKLENGDFSFQPLPYIRAFLKQYAKYIKLDPEQVLRDFEAARKGKYIPKYTSTQKTEEEKPAIEPEEIVSKYESVVLEEKPEVIESAFEKEEGEKVEKKIYSTPTKTQAIKETLSEPEEQKKPNFAKAFNENIIYFKYAGVFIIVIIILIGLFFIGKSLFFGNGSQEEIIRRTTVQETENKSTIDSIKAAREREEAEAKDKMVLKVVAIEDGRIIVSTDEKITKDTEVVEMKKGQERLWRAKDYFIVTTKNSNAFRVTLNDKKIKFKYKDTRNTKIRLDNGKVSVE
ncbi:MAG: helix-turn-helix domain-containing protein [Ignavibacteria bacterium]|nr:helix-turn-helix domain-containing protein [Ignavibacteria bacterium]